jgi:hypothetical protein
MTGDTNTPSVIVIKLVKHLLDHAHTLWTGNFYNYILFAGAKERFFKCYMKLFNTLFTVEIHNSL